MSTQTPFQIATAGHQEVPPDWMSATRVRPFIFEDPAVVWLEYHGEQHGFKPDSSPYEFLDFIGEKARQFEEKWPQEIAAGAVRVCTEAFEVRSADKVRETWELMQRGTPVIAQPALWWALERVYGVPDLLVHTSWLKEEFQALLSGLDEDAVAPLLADSDEPGYYVVFDIKFTTKLDKPQKAKDLENYAAQTRIYSYILGHLQGLMPQEAYLITRDRIHDALPVKITSTLNLPLDDDLAAIRDRFVEIKLNGAKYVPWKDDIVASNIAQKDERWATAKKTIAEQKVPGRDSGLLYYVGGDAKRALSDLGYPNLDSMLKTDPADVPFEKCKGLGPKRSKQIRTILKANRTGTPVSAPPAVIPEERRFEFFVDFEYLTNLNVDFDAQWPSLEGCEMIFMIGLGWEEDGNWRFESFVAEEEDQSKELGMFQRFLEWLDSRTNGALLDDSRTALYHWSSAEVWQTKRVSERHQLPGDNRLANLPWYDLQKVFLNGPCSVPGAWDYGLKEVGKALGKLNPEFDPQWPGDLDEGLRAMVMGWKAYENPNPLASTEMGTLKEYLEVDCKALWQILKWVRPF